MKHTPLHAVHVELGARLIDFFGWHMPVLYQSIPDEVLTVRRAVGIFDLCHMGRLTVTGPQREDAVQRVISNGIERIKPGAIRYALLCNEQGTILDDTLVYNDEPNEMFHIVVNASNREPDFEHIRANIEPFDATVTNVSDEQTMIALQGPASEAVMSSLTEFDLSELGYYRFRHGVVNGIDCIVSRTGYTGEDGFELFFPQEPAVEMWKALMAAGEAHGMAPIGLGARDVLRTEAAMPLYGQDIDLTTNPLEADIAFGVKIDKDFIGAEALREVKAAGLTRKRVGLEVDTKRVPRPGCVLLRGDEEIGKVTSGTYSPTLEKNIAMGYVPIDMAEADTTLEMDIRGRRHGARVVPLPFYKRPR
jgi:glycine cleavage system T protein (aminomethyltransferase)